MSDSAPVRELTAAECTIAVDESAIPFGTTSELESLDEIVGQPRALRALDVGLGVKHSNYHIYVSGLVGTGRMELLQRTISDRLGDVPTPPDWVYVNNFEQPDRPLAMSLPPGQGHRFREAMKELIDHLQEALPRAFREETFSQEKAKLRRRYRSEGESILQDLQKLAEQHGMAVEQTPNGQILFIPLKDGRPLKQADIEQLSPEQLAELETHQEELVEKAGDVLRRQLEIQRRLTTDVRETARRFAERLIQPLIDDLRRQFESPRLDEWLTLLMQHILDHLNRFRDLSEMPESVAALLMEEGTKPEDRFLDYGVNLVVNNSRTDGAPIVIEAVPNYRNLFGTIERVVDQSGRVTTNFARIKPGSLLEANGGYLIVDLMDTLQEPFVWKQLKRTLKSGSLEIEVHDPFSIFSISGMKPEPIPLNLRLIAVGEPLVYYLLYLYEEDFREIFRVKADFDDELLRDETACQLYGRLVRRLSDTEGTLPFDASGVAELVRIGARMASSKTKLSSVFSRVSDIIRESDFWARREKASQSSRSHVRLAERERVYRSDLIADKIRQLIDEGVLLINVTGTAVGQINGLSIADLGDYAFGRPSRVSASVGIGNAGVVNIERESRMSGSTYDKGLLILEGYLRNMYALDQPIALSASLAMEQSYGGIDGDSASTAELLVLLSGITGIPLRQDIAITGSINQQGEIQAIGGVNEKIEGFYDVCHLAGLTGSQGVCIPASNVQHLVLRPEVVEAVERGQFHIWPIKSIDEAIALFTNQPAGRIDDPDSFHGSVYGRLAEMIDILKEQRVYSGPYLWTPGMPTELPTDPRPPLPGFHRKRQSDAESD